jgi:hypothetical protein
MKLRLGFSVALIAVLYGFWVLSQKPACPVGFAASFGMRLGWSCDAVAK